MLLLVEICVVVTSLAVVVIAVATVRAMYCIGKVTDHVSRLTPDIQQWIGQANEFTREARETLVSARGVISPIRRIVDRFEVLGEHTADLSGALLEEVEHPLRAAVTVARGIRTVTGYFMKRLSNRFTQGRSATNGGSDNE